MQRPGKLYSERTGAVLRHGTAVDKYHIKTLCTYTEKNNFLKCSHLYYLYSKKFKVIKSKQIHQYVFIY